MNISSLEVEGADLTSLSGERISSKPSGIFGLAISRGKLFALIKVAFVFFFLGRFRPGTFQGRRVKFYLLKVFWCYREVRERERRLCSPILSPAAKNIETPLLLTYSALQLPAVPSKVAE